MRCIKVSSTNDLYKVWLPIHEQIGSVTSSRTMERGMTWKLSAPRNVHYSVNLSIQKYFFATRNAFCFAIWKDRRVTYTLILSRMPPLEIFYIDTNGYNRDIYLAAFELSKFQVIRGSYSKHLFWLWHIFKRLLHPLENFRDWQSLLLFVRFNFSLYALTLPSFCSFNLWIEIPFDSNVSILSCDWLHIY